MNFFLILFWFFFLIPFLLHLRDEADEVLASERSPCFALEVIVGEDTGREEPTPIPSLKGRALIFRNKFHIERAGSFPDRAVVLEIREAIDAVPEFKPEALEPPCVLDRLALCDRCSP